METIAELYLELQDYLQRQIDTKAERHAAETAVPEDEKLEAMKFAELVTQRKKENPKQPPKLGVVGLRQTTAPRTKATENGTKAIAVVGRLFVTAATFGRVPGLAARAGRPSPRAIDSCRRHA